MAMALSSTMAPTTALTQRRRRLPPSSGHTNRWSANNTNTNDTEEEKEPDGNMEPERARVGVRFAAFDAALRHSDETINGAPPSSAFPRRSRSAPIVGFPTRTRQRSSFFPDSTDDDESIHSLRRSSSGNNKQAPRLPTPTFPVIHIGDVQFPTTRTIMWDRRVLAGPFDVETASVLPRVRLTNRLLKELYALVHDKAVTKASRLLGYATTGEAAEDDGDSGRVTLSTLVRHKPDGGRTTRWSVPFYCAKPTDREDDEEELLQLKHAARARYESSSGTRRSRDGTNLPIEARGFVFKSGERSRAEIDVELDVVVPSVHLQFHLVRNLPLLMTPLAASLLRCEFGPEIQRFGFLTLDRTRKAVPLLETDPLVLQRPIVGMWVYGINVDDSDSAEAIHLGHPFLLESCVRYLSSKIIKERAEVEAGTFLVAVYPGNDSGPLPRFFECRATRPPQSSTPVGWRSASARTRCLAGVASFIKDLEVALVLASEQDSKPAMPTNVERSYDLPSHEHATPSVKVPNPVTAYPTRQRRTSDEFAQGSIQRDPPQESESMRSCCRSQQLLASHHQILLEQQQRQLQEMQEKIAQLERALSESQAEQVRLLAGSRPPSLSFSNEGSSPDPEQDDVDAPDEASSISVGAAQQSVEADGETSQNVDANLENDTSMVSSLALSSVSNDSNPSELSSLSSSLVGSRLKNLLTNHVNDGGATEGQDINTKQAGSPREPQAVDETENQGQVRDPLDDEAEDVAASSSDISFSVPRRTCPFVPSTRRSGRRAECERDEFEDESDASKIDELLTERLRIPVTPNREEIVRGGTLATIGFSHGSSFSIPKIKYVPEIVTCDSDEDEEEEIRRIEVKYRKRRNNVH